SRRRGRRNALAVRSPAGTSAAAAFAGPRVIAPGGRTPCPEVTLSASCTILVLIAALAGPALATAAAPDPAVAALLAAGDSSLVRLDLDAATAAFIQAHRAAPESYEAAWKLSRALADRATLSPKAVDQTRRCHK